MNSIRTRLLLWLTLPLALIAAFVSLETFFAARKVSNSLSDKTLLAASLAVLENVVASNGTLLAEATLSTLTESLGDQFFYHLRGPNGAFITGYSGFPRPPEGTAPQSEMPIFYDGEHLGKPVRAVQIQRDLTNRELNGVTTITTWQRTTQRDGLTFNLFARSLARLIVLVIAAGGIIWFAIRIGLRPLMQLQSAIDRRTPYDLTPIKRSMPLELKGIVLSMNELFERVARSKGNRERFIGDAAHQLRNPVAAIKIQAETAMESGTADGMRSGLEQILAVSNTSTQMINKMLSGASAHVMDRNQQKQFDIAAMLSAVVADAAPTAFEHGHDIALELETPNLDFQGNEILLREAMSNLIDNAIRYASATAPIVVALSTTPDKITLSVEDGEVVFSEEEFLRLSQPFYTSGGHSGSGLGLSIAKDIAKSHGGFLACEPSDESAESGKIISIVLPR